jgi:Predicted nucleoside-diphosphate-sugar epimerases
MIKSLVERLPVMLIPKWALMSAQPIAIDDLISYLIEALYKTDNANYLFEIGGYDQVSYLDIMRIYAKSINKRVLMIPVPVLTPYLSSLWLGLVTPLYARIGRKLVESIVHSTVVQDDTALRNFEIKPIGVEEAIQRAIKLENKESAASRWYDSTSSSGETNPDKGYKFGERLVDARTLNINVPSETAFNPIQHIGGEKGWYAWNLLWQLRGLIDLLLGGVGMRRGRSNKDKLIVGGTIDFWRIEKVVPNNFLSLSAEMKLPGRAWLEFEVIGNGSLQQ